MTGGVTKTATSLPKATGEAKHPLPESRVSPSVVHNAACASHILQTASAGSASSGNNLTLCCAKISNHSCFSGLASPCNSVNFATRGFRSTGRTYKDSRMLPAVNCHISLSYFEYAYANAMLSGLFSGTANPLGTANKLTPLKSKSFPTVEYPSSNGPSSGGSPRAIAWMDATAWASRVASLPKTWLMLARSVGEMSAGGVSSAVVAVGYARKPLEKPLGTWVGTNASLPSFRPNMSSMYTTVMYVTSCFMRQSVNSNSCVSKVLRSAPSTWQSSVPTARTLSFTKCGVTLSSSASWNTAAHARPSSTAVVPASVATAVNWTLTTLADGLLTRKGCGSAKDRDTSGTFKSISADKVPSEYVVPMPSTYTKAL
mmetsp:Transcript_73456/g.224660  ORF Transcript_73456/g.224660 Transcript_73456/m.224660 type:complete len:372 (+) Transcript_73456:522-1637(+)